MTLRFYSYYTTTKVQVSRDKPDTSIARADHSAARHGQPDLDTLFACVLVPLIGHLSPLTVTLIVVKWCVAVIKA